MVNGVPVLPPVVLLKEIFFLKFLIKNSFDLFCMIFFVTIGKIFISFIDLMSDSLIFLFLK